MSHTLFQNEDGATFWWKDCEITGCPNQVCTWKSDRFCWPHSDSGQTVDEIIAEHREPVEADVGP